MSTIADYSVFTKAFLASKDVDFSKLYFTMQVPKPDVSGETVDGFGAFAVVPMDLSTPLTTRGALNLDHQSWAYGDIKNRISCRDANGKFIGNIVRVQPGVREGSIRLVAKVAVPVASAEDVADSPYNTFVLLRAGSPTNVGADFSTNVDLPIAVATISAGYTLHKHVASGNDPLDDVENAHYVSFTINNLNGYTSVDFNPDAYATYDDVANALSRGIDGLHIAFDTASGDLKLLDKDGNVLDQANLPIKADVIIAEGEEGYKYVKTDVKQDIHAAKAWMPEGFTAWETVPEALYKMKHAALVVDKASTPASRVFVPVKSEGVSYPISTQPVEIRHVEIGGSTYMLGDVSDSTCSLFRVRGDAGSPYYHPATLSGNSVTIPDASTTESASHDVITSGVDVDVITLNDTLCVLGETNNIGGSRYRTLSTGDIDLNMYGAITTSGGSSADRVLGITPDGTNLYTFDENAETPSEILNSSGGKVRWLDIKPLTEVLNHTLKYGLEAFVWTVKDAEAGKKIIDPFFQQLNASLLALGFHEGDDIALGTNLAKLSTDLNGVDADEYIHGKDNKAAREKEVDEQRSNAKEELVAWNAQHPALTENRSYGTIIDSSGLDVRNGSITLGCGRVGAEDVFQKVNYGIQMGQHSGDGISESLDFTISHTIGNVQFNDNGHATNLTSSTLLSIEADSYISGAPTCLILAKVSRKPKAGSPNPGEVDPLEGSPVLTPLRMTAGFSVGQNYDASSGLNLTIHDDRENISAVFVDPNNNPIETSPAIIEVQAIYTHPAASSETVPAQQMHTYIGEWAHGNPRNCSFLCNKIEEWMTAIDLTDTSTVPEVLPGEVGLYVVIRVY